MSSASLNELLEAMGFHLTETQLGVLMRWLEWERWMALHDPAETKLEED